MNRIFCLSENLADNGEFSHWSAIDCDTGVVVWSQSPHEEQEKGVDIQVNDNLAESLDSICDRLAFSVANSLLRKLSSFHFKSHNPVDK
jgi:hypothetical protein